MNTSDQTSAIESVKPWLRSRIIGIMNVQNCFITPTNSLVIHTWTGVVINIFLLSEPVRTRAIRTVLQEGTQVGLGSMFILAANLIPPADTRFEPPEWLLALHALNRECLYAYVVDQGVPNIIQIHLEQIASSANYVAKYGPAVAFDELRYTKVSVKPRYLKGDWQVADFGYHPFWRDPRRPQYTAQYRRPSAQDYQWHSWSQTTWEQKVHTEVPAPLHRGNHLMVTYYQMLELETDASPQEVKAAFRRLALAVHPDTSTLPKEEAAKKFRELTEAYEFIKREKKW